MKSSGSNSLKYDTNELKDFEKVENTVGKKIKCWLTAFLLLPESF